MLSDYTRGRVDMVRLGEPVALLIEHLAVREIERRIGRELDVNGRLDLRNELANGLLGIAEREVRLAENAELVAVAPVMPSRLVGEPPCLPVRSGNPETDGLAADAYEWELREHESAADLAAEQWL